MFFLTFKNNNKMDSNQPPPWRKAQELPTN